MSLWLNFKEIKYSGFQIQLNLSDFYINNYFLKKKIIVQHVHTVGGSISFKKM